MTRKGINDGLQRLTTAAEIQPYTPPVERHRIAPAPTLRDSLVYRLLTEYDGYTLYNVRNRLRHKRLATTEQRYDHFDTA